MPKFPTAEKMHEWMNTIPMFGRVGAAAANFNLDNMQMAADRIGHPQNQFRSVHVAGTNGKGTVCSAMASVFATAGLRCGLYTSPHLIRVNERFRINGVQISDESMLDFFQQHGRIIDDIPLTYFEITTLIAFWWFARQKVDMAVIETGLGGRLDATNIITPELSVITSIGLDHTDILGKTLTEIAIEKAGIIKKGVPFVTGRLPESVLSVFSGFSNESYMLQPEEINQWQSDLNGPALNENLSLVSKCLKVLDQQIPVDEKIIKYGFSRIREFSGLKARFEKLHPAESWFFDGAHNADALRNLISYVADNFGRNKPVFVLSMMHDKLSEEVIELLHTLGEVWFVEMDHPRALKYTEICKKVSNIQKFTIDFVYFKSKVVIFCGSFYFYPKVIDWMDSFTTEFNQ